jgi:Fur family ferric uptake transcriptional regulator
MKATRNTIAKATILELISNSQVALSALEIQKQIGTLCDRVTTYRILDRLANEALLHKIITPDGTIKYASCHKECQTQQEHQHNHIHFSCEKCHSVTCLDAIEPTYTLPKNYLVKEANFMLSGLCPECL